MDAKTLISSGETALGIEFGSTRIKAQLISYDGTPLAAGSHDWENDLVNGIWTYSIEKIIDGLQDCYKSLVSDVKEKYGVTLSKVGSIGISAMMHGYMAFDKDDNLLVPFRTWRNTITGDAASKLTDLFGFNIPERWSIAHLYQAILNKEDHVKDVAFFTTLAGYIHMRLTGRKVLGIGDASGMFPIDSTKMNYDQKMMSQFDELVAPCGYGWKIADILPEVLVAGEDAGHLTADGARFLDPTGSLQEGSLLCPPEGDAGTGMTATNSVKVRTGNVSAGTSVFAMIVLEHALSKLYRQIDMVTTPTGYPVAMVHANNCTSDLNAWVGLFKEFADCYGIEPDMNKLYGTLYNKALEGDKDCGGLLAYGYFSGESITGMDEGRPLFVRTPNSKFTLSNFMRTHLYTALGALKIGMDILIRDEHVQVETIMGHGGLFKTKGVGQGIMAACMNTPVTVMKTAGEGGPWGMALLASYALNHKKDQKLGDYLADDIFKGQKGDMMAPDKSDVEGFEEFMKTYKAGLPIEAAAIQAIK